MAGFHHFVIFTWYSRYTAKENKNHLNTQNAGMKTLLMLHGWGQSKETWEPFRQQVEDFVTPVIPDLPGFGTEPLVKSEWGIPEYATWVANFVNKRKLSDVVLLGHSFGGRIAGFLASQRPAWLTSLVLSGAPCLYRPSFLTQAKVHAAKLVKTAGLKKIISQIRPQKNELTQADANGLGQIFRKVVPFDQTTTLPNITVPTLLIWGKNDQDAPLKIADEMHSLIKDSELVVIPDAGHNTFLEQPLLFYGTVKRFLKNNK